MFWLALVVSGVPEAVWATALGKSEEFSRLTPSVVFAVAATASFAGLAYAMRGLPIGTAYAVWVGIGAALTAGTRCTAATNRRRRYECSYPWASSAASSA